MNLLTKGGLTAVFCALSVFVATADTVPLASLSDPSIAPVSSTGAGDSGMPIISADGRYVLFASTANNLTVSNNVAAPSLMPFFNVYLRDRTNGMTTLVSVNYSGNGGGNGDSVPRGISTNGQFVLFESTARNLTTNNNSTNAVTFPGDVYVRDVVNGTTTLVSVTTNGSGPGSALNSVMSADGHLVAFASASTLLVSGDANQIKDVFVRDLQAGTTAIVSVGASGSTTNISESPAMTPDGRYVVFYSTATNLVPGVQTTGEIYERDLLAGTTTWVSKDARNLFFANVGTSNEVACNFKVSDDGNFIAYEACTNAPTNSLSNLAQGVILRFNVASNTTDVIETNANVPITAFESIHTLDMTPDGRFVAYVNNVNGLGSPTLGVSVWDAQSATSALVSVNTNGVASAGAFCDSPAISANGRWVSFVSSATDLTSNSVPSGYHAYLRDTLGGTTRLVDADLSGVGAGLNYGAIPSLSADGKTVAYESSAANVVSNDLNLRFDVFVVNTASNGTELVSARDAALPSVTPEGPSGQYTYSVSTTGRYVAFASDADDLTLNDTNGWRDVFVRDMLTGLSTLVSVATNGLSGTGMSFEPAISGTGRYVAFSSSVTNLVASSTANGEDTQVYVRDLQSNTTAMVSIGLDGVTAGNNRSFLPSISTDGRFVLFHSQASNLAPGSFGNGIENLFLRDLQLGTTYALTASASGTGVVSAAMTPDGRFVAINGPSISPSLRVWNTQLAAFTYSNSVSSASLVWISPDGQRLAYLSAANLNVTDLVSQAHWSLNAGGSLGAHPGVQFSADDQFLVYSTTAANVAADVNGLLDVYLYSFQNSSYTLVSSRLNPSFVNDSLADSPTLSADGRFVVYRSGSTNIVAGTGNLVANLLVYDRATGTNALLTQSRFGGGASAGQSRTPVFSGDGRTVVFQSWAPDLATGDFNTAGDMFAYSFFYLNETLASSSPAAIVLNWPVIPGQTYQAQYKNNLTDVGWQDLGGVVGIMGNQAFLTNPYVPFTAQQFYRVTAH